MPQTFWKCENKTGKDYEVSIYHGDTSGHVLLYSGHEIIKIDFSVFSDRSYSFMLGDEMFKLSIFFRDKNISYLLTNTDQNKNIIPFDGKNYPTYHIIKAIIFLFFVLLIVVLMWKFFL